MNFFKRLINSIIQSYNPSGYPIWEMEIRTLIRIWREWNNKVKYWWDNRPLNIKKMHEITMVATTYRIKHSEEQTIKLIIIEFILL